MLGQALTAVFRLRLLQSTIVGTYMPMDAAVPY